MPLISRIITTQPMTGMNAKPVRVDGSSGPTLACPNRSAREQRMSRSSPASPPRRASRGGGRAPDHRARRSGAALLPGHRARGRSRAPRGDERRGWVPSAPPYEDHLHLHRRGPRARDALVPADHRGVRRGRRRRRRDPRHLAGRADPLPVPRRAERGAAGARRAGRARRAGQDARRQHHQAAEHQRLDAAAEGGDQGAPGRRLRRSPTTRTIRSRRRRSAHARPTTRSRAARSTRSCARATPTAAPRPRSRSTCATTRTRWGTGRRTRRPMWRR